MKTSQMDKCKQSYVDYIKQTNDWPTIALMEYWFWFKLVSEIKENNNLEKQHTFEFEKKIFGCDIFIIHHDRREITQIPIQFGKTIKPNYEQYIREDSAREITRTPAHIKTSGQARRRKTNRKNTSGK